MLRVVYTFALLLLVVVMLPAWILRKKHRNSFLEKLGLKLPTFTFTKTGPRIWIHSISLGETKAVLPLITRLKEKYPSATLLLSTITETGQEVAEQSSADFTFYLPLDFPWAIRTLMNRIKPDLLILVEGDFWYNLIDMAPRVALVNGKISERSLSRFLKVPFFANKIFHKIELYCLQSARFADRFQKLGVDPSRIIVTGNLKFDQPLHLIDKQTFRASLGLSSTDRIMTLGSTHEPEEELILTALAPLLSNNPQLKILVVPRHPERFAHVKAAFADNPQVIVVDQMGVLNHCYQISELAIVGGSFISSVGGHNIFEPAALGTPVLFGPYMHSQKDLAELILQAGAGCQVTLENLGKVVENLLTHPPKAMREAGLKLAQEVHGATDRTLLALETLLGKKY